MKVWKPYKEQGLQKLKLRKETDLNDKAPKQLYNPLRRCILTFIPKEIQSGLELILRANRTIPDDYTKAAAARPQGRAYIAAATSLFKVRDVPAKNKSLKRLRNDNKHVLIDAVL